MFPLHFISVPAIITILFCTTLYISCIFIESRYIPRKAICTASKYLTPSSEFFHENLAVANPFNQHLYFMQFEATQQHGVRLAEPEKPSTHKHTHYFLIYCLYSTTVDHWKVNLLKPQLAMVNVKYYRAIKQ
jgi:hypothetical protein